MLRRTVYENLLNWKNNDKGSCAILIAGARRVGKSYIAEQFARTEYSHVYFHLVCSCIVRVYVQP